MKQIFSFVSQNCFLVCSRIVLSLIFVRILRCFDEYFVTVGKRNLCVDKWKEFLEKLTNKRGISCLSFSMTFQLGVWPPHQKEKLVSEKPFYFSSHGRMVSLIPMAGLLSKRILSLNFAVWSCGDCFFFHFFSGFVFSNGGGLTLRFERINQFPAVFECSGPRFIESVLSSCFLRNTGCSGLAEWSWCVSLFCRSFGQCSTAFLATLKAFCSHWSSLHLIGVRKNYFLIGRSTDRLHNKKVQIHKAIRESSPEQCIQFIGVKSIIVKQMPHYGINLLMFPWNVTQYLKQIWKFCAFVFFGPLTDTINDLERARKISCSFRL